MARSEASKSAQQKYAESHREERRAYSRAYYARNRERILQRTAEWYAADPDKRMDVQFRSRYNVDRPTLLASQDGRCAICAVQFDEANKPCIDHDHACCSGQTSCGACVRGALCGSCNRGLGSFADNPDYLMAAVAYLLARVDVLGGMQ